MIFQPFVFPAGPLEVNLYVIADESSREGALIDAGVFDQSVLDFVVGAGIRITHILLTHLHPDHVGGLGEYALAWNAGVVSPAPANAAPQARIVAEGDTVRVGGLEFRVLKTSGHTPESISYHCSRERVCFVGDAIFAGAVGGTNIDELHEEEIGNLRRNILTLAPETELHSGHGPVTTVAIEKAANPFLQPGFTRLP